MELEFFFDYTCPYCYMGYQYLKALIFRYPDIEIVWRPCEAHPEPEPRHVTKENPAWIETLGTKAAALGVPLNMPRNPASRSDLAMQGLFFMLEQGANIWQYNDQIYGAVFEKSQDIEDIDVLLSCIDGLNIDKGSFKKVIEHKTYEPVQKKFNNYAYEQNSVWAVPVYILGEERLDAVEGEGITENDLALFLREAHEAF